MGTLDWLRARLSQDDGFSLVEAVVSLLVAGIILSGLAGVLVTTVHAGAFARENQQAGDLANQQIEAVREWSFASLTMVNSTLSTTDPNLRYASGQWSFVNPISGTSEIVAAANVGNPGLASPSYMQSVQRNGVTYTLATYVTCPTSLSPSCVSGTGVLARRVTVVVTFMDRGQKHTRLETSIVTNTRRGLPLPYFRFGYKKLISANIGGPIIIPVSLTNLGARDAWNVTTNAGIWQWWDDVNCDGVVQTTGSTPDLQMTAANGFDTDANGVPDTGTLETGSTFCMVLTRTASGSDVTAGTENVTMTATSIAQPTASSGTQSFTDLVQTSANYCPGCVSSQYYLHNQVPNSGNTQSVSVMPLNVTAPAATTLWDYSTDLSGSPGRYVMYADSRYRSNNKTYAAVWQRQCSVSTAYASGGYASVTLSFVPAAGAGVAGTITAKVGTDTNGNIGGFVEAGEASYTLTSASNTGSFYTATISILITTALSIPNGGDVEFRIEVPSSSGSMQLAYDTTTYVSQVSFPLTNAC